MRFVQIDVLQPGMVVGRDIYNDSVKIFSQIQFLPSGSR